MFGHGVADGSAKRAADGHSQKRQGCVDGAGLQVQAPHSGEIEIEPAKENPGHVTEAKVRKRKNPDIETRQDGRPGKKAVALRSSRAWDAALDVIEFIRRQAGMLIRRIARGQKPYGADGKPD